MKFAYADPPYPGQSEPDNCRWATWSEQMKNRRRSEASIANLKLAPGRVKAAAKRAAAP